MSENQSNVTETKPNNDKRSGFSLVSLFLSAAPPAILLLGFIFCLIVSAGSAPDNDRSAIWWLMIALITIVGPVSIVTNILSLIFGIIGLKGKKTLLSWAGIIFVFINILIACGLYLFLVS